MARSSLSKLEPEAESRFERTPDRSRNNPIDKAEFRPFFIVGCQRSGTTALAVMFDRHSGIAIPSETDFFNLFEPQDRAKRLPMTHESLLTRACEDFFIHQAGFRYEGVIDQFRKYEPTYANLFRALLESHSGKQGKRRSGEKTCDHLSLVRRILRIYPESQVICIVRDGRDVVRSISAAWGHTAWPVLCRQWNDSCRLTRYWQRTLPADRFSVVNYSDLMCFPEREMRRLCEFINEEFEPSQIEGGGGSATVPAAELAWKAKAREGPDPSRVGAWRKCEDRRLIAKLNYYMGRTLREWGYPDTEVTGISLGTRLRWWIQYIPCWRGVFPVALRVKQIIRALRRPGGGPAAPSALAD
jgi:sulfotransferase family protein